MKTPKKGTRTHKTQSLLKMTHQCHIPAKSVISQSATHQTTERWLMRHEITKREKSQVK